MWFSALYTCRHSSKDVILNSKIMNKTSIGRNAPPSSGKGALETMITVRYKCKGKTYMCVSTTAQHEVQTCALALFKAQVASIISTNCENSKNREIPFLHCKLHRSILPCLHTLTLPPTRGLFTVWNPSFCFAVALMLRRHGVLILGEQKGEAEESDGGE